MYAAFTSLACYGRGGKHRVYTRCCLLVDKEEIGSVGATGMQLHEIFENTVAEVTFPAPVSIQRSGTAPLL